MSSEAKTAIRRWFKVKPARGSAWFLAPKTELDAFDFDGERISCKNCVDGRGRKGCLAHLETTTGHRLNHAVNPSPVTRIQFIPFFDVAANHGLELVYNLSSPRAPF